MATGATEHIDATTADAAIAEIWSRKAQIAREENLVLAELVNTDYREEMSYGDTLHVFNVSNLTVQTKNRSANAAVLYETVTETNTDLTVGTWEYSAVAIETATARQVSQDLLERYAPKQSYALAESLDAGLAARIDDFSQTVGTLTVENTYDELLRAVQYLDDANAPQTGRAFFISPAAKAGFMKLDAFVNADYSKLNADFSPARKESLLGSWMGIPIYFSTNVEGTNGAGHDNGLFQREAVALIAQMRPTTHTMFDIDYLARKVVVEQLYGLGEMRDDHGVWIKGA